MFCFCVVKYKFQHLLFTFVEYVFSGLALQSSVVLAKALVLIVVNFSVLLGLFPQQDDS